MVDVKLTVVVWITLLRLACTVALWAMPMFPETAVKRAVDCPERTFTLPGTMRRALLLLRETAVVPLTGPLNDTVHELEELLPRVEGEQETDDS